MGDLEFLEELAEQIQHVGVSRSTRTARQLRDVVERLQKPGNGLVQRSRLEAIEASEKTAHREWNRAANTATRLASEIEKQADRIAVYCVTGRDPVTDGEATLVAS